MPKNFVDIWTKQLIAEQNPIPASHSAPVDPATYIPKPTTSANATNLLKNLQASVFAKDGAYQKSPNIYWNINGPLASNAALPGFKKAASLPKTAEVNKKPLSSGQKRNQKLTTLYKDIKAAPTVLEGWFEDFSFSTPMLLVALAVAGIYFLGKKK